MTSFEEFLEMLAADYELRQALDEAFNRCSDGDPCADRLVSLLSYYYNKYLFIRDEDMVRDQLLEDVRNLLKEVGRE